MDKKRRSQYITVGNPMSSRNTLKELKGKFPVLIFSVGNSQTLNPFQKNSNGLV